MINFYKSKIKNFIIFSMTISTLNFCVVMAKENNEDQALLKTAQENFSPIKSLELPQSGKEFDSYQLGKKLYFEKKLSSNGTVSCNSCHDLANFGVDGLKTSLGHNKAAGTRNAPSVYNSSLHFSQFWDGRAANLEEQAQGPLLNPIEHGIKDEAQLISILKTEEYVALFNKVYSEQPNITLKNVGHAIASFEKYLLTPSKFDDYLSGKIKVLSKREKRGLKKFLEVGCSSCHQGEAIGGTMFQKLGLVKDYPTTDLGRFDITKQEEDKYVFKVPSLRNVAKTAPYFHDGSVEKLENAVQLMGRHQLGIELKKNEIDDITLFLATLTAKSLPKFN